MSATPPPESLEPEVLGAPAAGYWRETWRRFRRRKLSMLALGMICLLAAIGILAPFIVGTKPIMVKYKGNYYFPAMAYFSQKWENVIFYEDRFRGVYPDNLKQQDPDSWAIWPLVYQDPYRRVRAEEYPGQPASPPQSPPSRWNIFGTDRSGYDVFAIMVHGATTALLVGFVSMGIAATIGLIVGALAGYFGGWVDMLLSRVIEVVMCVPSLVLILALIAVLERVTIWHIMAVIGVTSWTDLARLTRAEFLKLKESDFVAAARASGMTQLRIMFRHILPNALGPVMVPVAFGIAGAILVESALSFLGFGPPPPSPSWGSLLSAGRANPAQWWLIVFPGLAIFFTVLSYNLVGEGIQDSTDPRLRGR